MLSRFNDFGNFMEGKLKYWPDNNKKDDQCNRDAEDVVLFSREYGLLSASAGTE